MQLRYAQTAGQLGIILRAVIQLMMKGVGFFPPQTTQAGMKPCCSSCSWSEKARLCRKVAEADYCGLVNQHTIFHTTLKFVACTGLTNDSVLCSLACS